MTVCVQSTSAVTGVAQPVLQTLTLSLARLTAEK